MEHIDYRQLCRELFGTDDVAQLKKIAEAARKKNSRNAGRKKKFTEQDIGHMRSLQLDGVTISEIARRYGTTRQCVSKHLNGPLDGGYTMRILYMYRKTPCTTIDLDFLRQKIRIQNQTNDVLHRAFGANEEPTWRDFEQFLQERCFPKTRGLLKERLRELGLDAYDPLQIVEKTKGRTAEDDMWLKFQYRQETGARQ